MYFWNFSACSRSCSAGEGRPVNGGRKGATRRRGQHSRKAEGGREKNRGMRGHLVGGVLEVLGEAMERDIVTLEVAGSRLRGTGFSGG